MNLLEKLEDLYKQATTEHSHNYTASVLAETIAYLKEDKQRQNAVQIMGGLRVIKSHAVHRGNILVSYEDFPENK